MNTQTLKELADIGAKAAAPINEPARQAFAQAVKDAVEKPLLERIQELESKITVATLPTPPTADVKTPGYEEIAEFLCSLGWTASNDAQWEGLRDALPELRAMISGQASLEAGIKRMEAVPWNELPGEVLTAESIRTRLIAAAREGQPADKPKAEPLPIATLAQDQIQATPEMQEAAEAVMQEVMNETAKPWTLPAPPEGQQWHRTDWTEDMLPYGWRPLLKGEVRASGDEYQYTGDGCWGMCQVYADAAEDSKEFYRTRRPLPQPPVLIPLDASDIRATDEFRAHGGTLVQSALYWTVNEVELPYTGTKPYNVLAEHYERRQHGSTEWKPCTKPAP